MAYNPLTGLPLKGTETLEVLGQTPSGVPAASTYTITTGDIALLAEAGSGNVVGPASNSADGNVALFNGTTGKLLKDSGVPLLMFKTISVGGQSDIVADSSTDVLTVAAGANVTITTNAGTDTITIAASGGSAPGPYLVRNDATALSAATILANTAGGNNRYVLTSATGVPITLPSPTGTGTVLEFLIDLKSTSNGYVFDTGVGGAGINPFISALSGRASLTGGAISSVNVTAAGAHNRMTLLNGVAGTGGDKGDVIYITDAIAGQYQVSGLITVDTTTATFSAY